METFKPINSFRGRAALLACACVITPVKGAEPQSGANTSASETARRSSATAEARLLLKKGDESYEAARYADAVEAYAGARGMIPNAPASAVLREAATQRFAQASVERARELSRLGDVAGAKQVVDRVLEKSVAPNDPGAVAFRAQLDDPIRTNPALTAEHAKDVDEVRRLLYTAEGAYNLGKYDEADATYQKVLRIDPTNTAARRGMELAAEAKTTYYDAARDDARAEMLGEVDRQWELQVPPNLAIPNAGDYGMSRGAPGASIREKLDRIVIPQIALDQATLGEALDFLRLRSAEYDTQEDDQEAKGINFTLNLGPPNSPEAQRITSQKFNLHISNVPVSQVLKYLTEITGTSYTTDNFAVVIRPSSSSSEELVTETYRVPPDFIGSLSTSGTGAGDGPVDPFADVGSKTSGILPQRMGVLEALKSQGVTFPEGAGVTYTPKANMLRVVNTRANQDFIARIVDTLASSEPIMVVVKVTMIRVQQTVLDELGFDWMLNSYGFGGPSWVAGQAKYNLTGGTTGNGAPITDIPMPSRVSQPNPITAGNRSGDFATSSSTVDGLLQDSSGRQTQERAPGVMGLTINNDGRTVQALMRGLAQKKGVDLMAQPTTVTRSGQVSKIEMVRELIYPTEFEPPELPNSVGDTGGGQTTPVTPTTPTAFDMKPIGITLEVLPVVDSSKQFVSITLTPVIRDFDGFVNYGSPINTTKSGLFGPTTVELTPNAIVQPIFSVQKVSTTLNVVDGGTVYAGGLLQDSKELVEDKTPILGSIPIIGRLFQSKANKSTSTAVLFLVNVELMDPTGHRLRDR